MINYYCPVFEKDESEFIIAFPDYICQSKSQAYKIGSAAVDLTFIDKVLKINKKDGLAHIVGKIGNIDILIVAGKLFDLA